MNQATPSPTLYLAFELGQKQWRLGFTVGLGQPPRQRIIAAGDLPALQREITLARKHFGLPEDARIDSCYEAWRDGFWLHRYLTAHGVENQMVDSASIEANRRARRATTDHLDVGKLATMLIRFDAGDQRVWSVVHLPDPQVEDRRHLHRQLATLKADRTRHLNRIQGLLAGQGVCLPLKGDFLEKLARMRL